MDYLFIFLLSTGFVGGIFAGLKKSAKTFVVLFLTFAIFAIIFSPIVDFVLSQAFFKTEFSNFISGSLSSLTFLWTEYENSDLLLQAMNDSSLPDFLIELVISLCKKTSSPFVLGKMLIEYLYKFIVVILLAVVILAILYVLLSMIFNIVFIHFGNKNNMFVTKRVLAGVVGGLKGVVLFIGMEIAVVFVCQLFGLSFLENYVKDSSVISISYDFISTQVGGFITKVFY